MEVKLSNPRLTETHSEERERIDFAPDDSERAVNFCQIMRHKNAPVSFNIQIIDRLKKWNLIDKDFEPKSILTNYTNFRQKIQMAEREARRNTKDFRDAFNKSPWNFDSCIEGDYTEDELVEHFPDAIQIKNYLSENLKFSFRADPREFYQRLLTREDGRRQILRIFHTVRDINIIKSNIKNSPSIIPPFEAIELSNGRIGILIEWIDGHKPTTKEEIEKCLVQAEMLLRVPVDEYDLKPENFVIQIDTDKIFYVDRDAPEAIIGKGLVDKTEEREEIFNKGKIKMR